MSISIDTVERGVLGILLLEPTLLHECAERVKPERFARRPHSLIAQAILALYANSKPVDVISVRQWLEAQGKLAEVGGTAYLHELLNRVGTTASLEYYLEMLDDAYLRRELTISALHISELSKDANLSTVEMLSQAEALITKLSAQAGMADDIQSIAQVAEQSLARMVEFRERGYVGHSSGWASLDSKIQGIRTNSLVEIAARPGVGKTTLALQMAWRMAEAGIKVGFISMEMPPEDLTDRILQSCARASFEQLVSPTPEVKQRLSMALSGLLNKPLYFTYTLGDTDHVCHDIRRLVLKKGCQVVFVDHFQCINDTGNPAGKEAMYADSLSRLSNLRKQLGIVLVLCVQINRDAERNRAEPRPKLWHLRDTGKLEMEGDLVLGLFRPDVAGSKDEKDKNVLEVEVLKNRFGPVGKLIRLVFLPEQQRMEELALSPESSESSEESSESSWYG